MTTGVIFSDDFRRHDPGKGHPESAERMGAVARAIGAPDLASRLEIVSPKPAEKEHILLVHWERLYDEVMATRGKERTYLDSDTIASPATADVAVSAIRPGSLAGFHRNRNGTWDAPDDEVESGWSPGNEAPRCRRLMNGWLPWKQEWTRWPTCET